MTTFAIQLHQLLRFASLMVISIVVSKSGFAMQEIGQLESWLYIVAALSVFVVNGMIQGLLSFYHQKESEAEKQSVLQNIYLIFLIYSILIFSVLYFLSPIVFSFFGVVTLPYPTLFATYFLLSIPTNLLEYFYLLKENAKAILASTILTFLANCSFAFFIFFYDWQLKEIVISWIFVFGVKHLFLIKYLYGYMVEWLYGFSFLTILAKPYNHITIQPLKTIFLHSFPLILYAFVGNFAVSFDAWLVNFWYAGDAEKFAIFRFGSRELPFVMALAVGLSNSMVPLIGKNMQEALPVLKEKSLRLMHLLFPMSILILATSQFWFTRVFNDGFEASVLIFDIYILLIISRLLFPQSIVLGLGNSKIVFYLSIIELSVNVILSFIFIYFFGLAGVAWATFLAFLWEKIALAWWLKKYHHIDFQQYTPLKVWILYSLVIGLVFIFKVLQY